MACAMRCMTFLSRILLPKNELLGASQGYTRIDQKIRLPTRRRSPTIIRTSKQADRFVAYSRGLLKARSPAPRHLSNFMTAPLILGARPTFPGMLMERRF
jgi:hypothetical protein